MWREYPKVKPDEILVYLRKSQSDDASLSVEEVLSRHEKDLKRWQDANLEGPIPDCNYYREVVSGESISARKEFNKLLKRIESPNTRAVLVVDCARLGRPNTEEIGRITNLFRFTNTFIITPQRPFDLIDEWDREQFEREMMRNRDYLDYVKKALGRGKENSLRDGWYINAVIPYGYEREWVTVDKRERPTLKIVEEEAQIVRQIFDWYVNDGIGATKICQKLNAMGIKARKGGLWKKSSVINMLKNEHYMGKIVLKKHIDVNTVQDQEITKRCLFNKDFEIVEGKHPAIIDEETFYKANNKIHKYPSVKPSETLQNPFASVLKCECGRCMRRSKDRDKFRYLCDEQMFCGNASVSEQDLISAVIEELTKALDNYSVEITADDETKKEKHLERISLLESRLLECEKKELSIWDKYTEEQMPRKVFDKLIQKNTEEKQQIEMELEIATSTVPKCIDYNGAVESLHKAIESLKNDSVSASVKNKLLKSVIDVITYSRPKSIRLTPEEAKAKGLSGGNGWYRSPFVVDIALKI
jgi:hypothetical protein